jgi:hypothetical protein
MCQPGREVPGEGILTNELVVEDAWGELWRASHETHGRVLFAAYTTVAGEKAFRESLPSLRRWKMSAAGVSEVLGTLLHISDKTAIPYVLYADPGGATLRERIAADTDETIDPQDVVKWLVCWLRGSAGAFNLDCIPAGLTPDTLFEAPGFDKSPWRIISLLPASLSQKTLMAGGRYFPACMRESTEVMRLNPDTHALTWLATEAIARNFDMVRDADVFFEAVPVPKLSTILENGIVEEAGGKFPTAASFEQMLVRWYKNDAEADLRKFRKQWVKSRKKRGLPPLPPREAPAGRKGGKLPPVNGRSSRRARETSGGPPVIVAILLGLLKATLVIGAVVGGAYGGWVGVNFLLKPSYSMKTAQGAAYLYGMSFVNNSIPELEATTSGEEALWDSREILQYLAGRPMSEVRAVCDGQGSEYIGIVEIRDSTDKLVVMLTVKVRKEGEEFRVYQTKATGGEFLNWIGIK